MSNYRSHTELEVWKRARAFVTEIYKVTNKFPDEERYGLISQMRRCAVSVPSNIAEGYGRQFKKETIQFLHIARGSLFEIETQIYVAFDLLYLNDEQMSGLILKTEECRKLLSGLINYFENNTKLK